MVTIELAKRFCTIGIYYWRLDLSTRCVPFLCDNSLEEYFEIPENINTIYLDISAKPIKESLRFSFYDSKIYVGGECRSMYLGLLSWLYYNLKESKHYYVRVRY